MEASLVLICQLREVGKLGLKAEPHRCDLLIGSWDSGEAVNCQWPAFASSEKTKGKATLLHGHIDTIIHANLPDKFYYYIS